MLLIVRYRFARHNEDGSYTYGYEGADGSFKIETKTRSGEVTGKYGYVDDSGKLRVVEYGANRHGFQPSGEGITVPPPTLVQLRPDNDDDDDDKTGGDVGADATPEARRPRPQPAQRPSPPAKTQRDEPPASRDYDQYDDGFAQQQAGFDDGNRSWARQKPEPAGPRVPAPLYRPAPTAARFGGAARPKSAPRPAVGGPFEPVPSADGPSGSYRSVQDFGAAGARRDQPAARRLAAAQPSYETFEDQEGVTEAPLYAPVAAKTAARRDGGRVPARFAAAPSSARQMRAGGVLDQLAEQYALPESGSPVSHSVSFGLDQ